MKDDFIDFVPIQLERHKKIALYVQLYEQLREMIEKNTLSSGYLLPPIRRFAAFLGINVGTVVSAYKLLETNGYLFSREGSGSYVAELKAADYDEAGDRNTGYAMEEMEALPPRPEDQYLNLASIALNPELICVEAFKKVLVEVLDRDQGYAFGYQESKGFYPLRESFAAYLSQSGICCEASDVQIISGAQQGIDIVAKAFLEYGDYVLTENPTYAGAIAAFRSRGAKIIEVQLLKDGIDISQLEDKLRRFRPKLIYVMPNIQNPTGCCYSAAKRARLMGLAHHYGAVVLEDDYISDLTYGKECMAPLKVLDRDGRVIYLKSFSKIFMPGLRLAFLMAPPKLTERLLSVKFTSDISTSGLAQRAFDLYLRKGIWLDHIRQIRALYADRFDSVLTAVEEFLPAAVQVVRPEGGLSIWLTLPEGISARRIVEEARCKEVLIIDGKSFFPRHCPDRNIRISFATATTTQIRRGLNIVGQVIEACMKNE